MDQQEITLLDVFDRVAHVSETRVDELHESEIKKITGVSQKIHQLQKQIEQTEKRNEGLPTIACIDISEDTSMLNEQLEEQQRLNKLQRNFLEYTTEKEALKIAFAPVKALVMNKDVFYDLLKQFGLIRLYDSGNNEYAVTGNLTSTYQNYLKRIKQNEDHYNEQQKEYQSTLNNNTKIASQKKTRRVAFVSITAIAVSILSLFFMIEPMIEMGFTPMIATIINIVGIVAITLLTYALTAPKKAAFVVQPIKNQLTPFVSVVFPNGVIKHTEPSGVGTWTYFKIGLPRPPEHVRKKIISALQLHQQIGRGDLCTVADPLACTVELVKTHTVHPPIPPRPADPGVVIEFKHFAVILPETFYNITSTEAHFLTASLEIAEHWDIKKYMLN
jgi:hypothetical protein